MKRMLLEYVNAAMKTATYEKFHTWFMSISIDVVFLDGKNRVVGLKRNMKPFRMAGAWRAVRALELPVGTIAATGTPPGDVVAFRTEAMDTPERARAAV